MKVNEITEQIIGAAMSSSSREASGGSSTSFLNDVCDLCVLCGERWATCHRIYETQS